MTHLRSTRPIPTVSRRSISHILVDQRTILDILKWHYGRMDTTTTTLKKEHTCLDRVLNTSPARIPQLRYRYFAERDANIIPAYLLFGDLIKIKIKIKN